MNALDLKLSDYPNPLGFEGCNCIQLEAVGAAPHNQGGLAPNKTSSAGAQNSQAKYPHFAIPLAFPLHFPHLTPMPALTPVPKEIPDSFFVGLPDPATLPRAHPDSKQTSPTAPMRALMLYDAIIDDIFANPTTTLGATAGRLRKSPSTISLVVRSDFFRARWLQRREQYNEDLNFRLTAKITKVVEKSLDVTLEKLETSTNIPLPMLNEMNKTLLDRLGYGPSRSESAPGTVVNVGVQANANAAVANAQASPEGLSRAREFLKILEQRNADSGHRPGNSTSSGSRDSGEAGGPVVEGEVVESSNASSS
jgi:hypothetical protein